MHRLTYVFLVHNAKEVFLLHGKSSGIPCLLTWVFIIENIGRMTIRSCHLIWVNQTSTEKSLSYYIQVQGNVHCTDIGSLAMQAVDKMK